ncbi:hypothetical protein [Acidocella facilis]|uniref:hypothetical protein n=1 Tax=Acidocella facilis TaxID=525 RepID=UPI001F3D704A|nr:hypothetical protein [Acidocella facilis]
MYSEQDLDEAVQHGAITAQNAAALREFVAARRQLPAVDEEYVRLLSGFNDIFVSIAIALVGIATFVLAGDAWSRGLAMAAEAWVMAEYFTRRRRMALPSILLLLLYAQGVALLLMHVIGVYVADHLLAFLPYGRVGTKSGLYLTTGFTAGFEALAIYAHWWRFKVPITVAAGCGALVGLVVFLALGFAPGLLPYWPWLMIAGGLAVFAVALWWDMSDRARITRRADVAFWLHLLAAPMLVHPAFYLLGLLQGGGDAAMAVALYAVLAMVALLVDRRALLVSALGYVIYALAHVLRQSGSEAQSLAVTALIAGCALLLLSAFWHRVRAALLRLLPVSLTAKLPA